MSLTAVLDAYLPHARGEVRDVERIRALAATGDPWARSSPLHVTGSAVVIHPETGRLLLRWHDRMQSWLQVGGHADLGESDPHAVAVREAREETGLRDLAPWPDAGRPLLVHVVIVPVPASRGEPSHEHADFRYVIATSQPDEIVAESAAAELRWLTYPEAIGLVDEDNLRTTLQRVAQFVAVVGRA